MPWCEVFPEPALGADRQQALSYHIYCAPGRSNTFLTFFTWNTRCQLRHLRIPGEVMVTIGQLGCCAMLLNRFSMLGLIQHEADGLDLCWCQSECSLFFFIKIPRLKMNWFQSILTLCPPFILFPQFWLILVVINLNLTHLIWRFVTGRRNRSCESIRSAHIILFFASTVCRASWQNSALWRAITMRWSTSVATWLLAIGVLKPKMLTRFCECAAQGWKLKLETCYLDVPRFRSNLRFATYGRQALSKLDVLAAQEIPWFHNSTLAVFGSRSCS